MKSQLILVAACLLSGPASAMTAACDRYEDARQRSDCHAWDDAQWRARPPGPTHLQQRIEAADALQRLDDARHKTR